MSALRLLMLVLLALWVVGLNAQNVGISEDGSIPNNSAILDLKSTSRGLLLPRLTDAQRLAIQNPAKGLVIYNIDTDCQNYFNGTQWIELCGIPICNPAPTFAVAGPDQLNVVGTKTTLQGNIPFEGVGSWLIVSGTGGYFDTISKPKAIFYGLAGNQYVLRWIISNNCRSTQDEVVVSFIPPPCGAISTVSDIDGNVYDVVNIGSQCWMAHNLKTTRYRNGNNIPNQTNQTTWIGLTTGAWVNYGNNTANDATYGKLYNWFAVNDSRNICPTGWHVPSDNEFITLVDFLGGQTVAGAEMKSTSSLWKSPNQGANNQSGFSGLPGGTRNYLGNFNWLTDFGYFWTSTENDATMARARNLSYSTTQSIRVNNEKKVGFSVRCVKD